MSAGAFVNEERAATTIAANAVARESRYGGAPVLTPQSDRRTLLAWLQWCDPNGEWGNAEEMQDVDLSDAWIAIADMVEGSS